jgi:hypothetical protein
MSPLKRTIRQDKVGRPICPICNEPVTLETCKVNEHGKATQEECYVEKMCSQEKVKQDQEETVRRLEPRSRKLRSR